MSPTVRQATDEQLIAHYAGLDSDMEFFPLLTVGMDLHAIEQELRRRGYRQVTDWPPRWQFWRRPVRRWAKTEDS